MTRRPVFVAGCGQIGPVADDPRSIPEIVLQAVEGALEDAGITHKDIDAVVTASVDILDGLTASNIAVTEVVGAVMKPEARIAAASGNARARGRRRLCRRPRRCPGRAAAALWRFVTTGALLHRLIDPPAELAVGQRVRAQFANDRKAHISDLAGFVVTGEQP